MGRERVGYLPKSQRWKGIVDKTNKFSSSNDNISDINPPEELLFKTGIAHPLDDVIEGKGVGAIRKCNFTTDSFIETNNYLG